MHADARNVCHGGYSAIEETRSPAKFCIVAIAQRRSADFRNEHKGIIITTAESEILRAQGGVPDFERPYQAFSSVNRMQNDRRLCRRSTKLGRIHGTTLDLLCSRLEVLIEFDEMGSPADGHLIGERILILWYMY